MTAPTLFELCAEAAWLASDREPDGTNMAEITCAVLQALADHTPSPRCQDEVLRVLGEAGE